MFKELRKKSFKKSLIFTVILIFFGSCFVFGWIDYAKASFNGFTPFKNLEPDEINNQIVEVSVTENYGCFMNEYTLYIIRFIPIRERPKKFYYIIQTGDPSSADRRFIAVKVPKKYRDRMDEMAENTYNGITSAPINFTGRICQMDKKESGYLKDFFTSVGWTEEEINRTAMFYYIDAAESPQKRLAYFYSGVALLALAVYRLIRGAVGGYLKSFRKTIKAAGYNESDIESDFRSATSCNDDDSIKIGLLCTYYNLDATVPEAAPNNKIIWVYQDIPAKVKEGAQTKVQMYVEGIRYSLTLYFSMESDARDFLDTVEAMFPWVVVGYTDELKELFDNNREQFLQLKYNTVEHVAKEHHYV